MVIIENGQTIILGDEAYAELVFVPTLLHWGVLVGVLGVLVPSLSIFAFDPAIIHKPAALLEPIVAIFILLGAVLAVRHVLRIVVGSEEVLAVTFERQTATLRIIHQGFFGLTQSYVPFMQISAFRQGRGEWDGDKVKELTLIDFHSGGSMVLPVQLSVRELTILRVLTGLRRI